MLLLKSHWARAVAMLILSILCLVSLYPFLYMLLMSLKSNHEILFTNPFGLPEKLYFQNYANAWSKFDIPAYFKNSVSVTLLSVSSTVFFATLFSYAVTRLKTKWSNAANSYISIGLFIPMQIILIPMVVLVKRWHMANTHLALIIPYIAFELPFSCLIMYGFMRQIPREFEEAAYIDGAGVLRTFLQIICPMLIPALSAACLYAFIGVWNEFTVALIMISEDSLKTLPLGLLNFKGQHETDWGGMGAAMILATIPAVVLYMILGKQLEKALSIGAGIKG